MSIYDIADDFIQLTNSPVFLTGKAGTGKTTLLRRIQLETHKQVAVVAPTGVAAINAGGTTIHSFFQLPLSPFIPTPEARKSFIAKQQVNEVRRKVFCSLELLIIDEISMVRADVLDAIDTVLRHYRYRRNEPFGGVQVVYIGDMYQLPPVCVGDEWNLLREFYRSPYFFHSHAVMQQQPYYLELDQIFRQSNQQFVNLLNEVRNNTLSQDSFSLLNMRYNADFRAVKDDGFITLTTHNSQADAINSDEIAKLDTEMHSFRATVQGDFSEKLYPTDMQLQLKEGARVMFIANDKNQPRRYFNGKLGVVSSISDDEIWVICDGETEAIQVGLEEWENKSYSINPKNKELEEKKLGAFMQRPLRLAWAITIHKSQGLTFDKVVVDAAAAFASGQVYVALSRCRSLDGIVLTSQISSKSLSVDREIVAFSNSRISETLLQEQLEIFKARYCVELLVKLFTIEELVSRVFDFVTYVNKIVDDFNPETKPFIDKLQEQINQLYSVSQKFAMQLNRLSQQGDTDLFAERVAAAANYYANYLSDYIQFIESSPAVTDSKTEGKDYTERLKLIFELASFTLHMMRGIEKDASVNNYFAVKQKYIVPRFTVKAYVIEKKDVPLLVSEHPELYRDLSRWRREYCSEHDIPAYRMFTSKTLLEVSNTLPRTLKELAKIKGFGKIKTARYGEDCLDFVRSYCRRNGLEPLSFD